MNVLNIHFRSIQHSRKESKTKKERTTSYDNMDYVADEVYGKTSFRLFKIKQTSLNFSFIQ